ncbi:hypothetical protein C8T65DRAFT_735511 [Cerioporus squamosus]|nr:hypothetical protein C8T65DRAFT_735511 [Cerioporus squamosus]
MDAPGWDDLVFAEEILESNRVTQYVFASTFALLFYEYMITFDLEVQYAWGRRLTWARAMFFLNRYLSLLQYFATFASTILPPSYFAPHSRLSADAALQLRIPATSSASMHNNPLPLRHLGRWNLAVFSGLHVYAISGNRKLLVYLVVFLALIPVATCIALDALCLLSDYPLKGADQLLVDYSLDVATRILLLQSEAIVIIVTLIQTRNAYLEHPEQQNYASLILQEGVLYFGAMLVVNNALFEIRLVFVCVFLNLIR